MHRERRVRQTTSATAYNLMGKGTVRLDQLTRTLGVLQLRMANRDLALLLDRANSRSMNCTYGAQLASRKGTAIVARAVIVETLTDDLATADDDATMTVMERRHSSLLEAQGEIHIVRRHFGRFDHKGRKRGLE